MVMLVSTKCPNEELATKNVAFVNNNTLNITNTNGSSVRIKYDNKEIYFKLMNSSLIPTGQIAFTYLQRKVSGLGLGVNIDATICDNQIDKFLLTKCLMEVDFFVKNKASAEPFDTDKMSQELTSKYSNHPITAGYQMFLCMDNRPVLLLTVKEVEGVIVDKNGNISKSGQTTSNVHLLLPNTNVTFVKSEESVIVLTGKSKEMAAAPVLIDPSWKFSSMGIGGLDNEFSAIFRRAFASRLFPPELIEQLGLKHCRGILLYGPPGTGKTLMARQIGKMLNAREPKIVSGPSVLSKFVGESEAAIRKLFEDAEFDQKKFGINSGLHIIIFDEIDAICKQRGSTQSGSGVHDTIVNQLLTKIDGVEQLNNILIIGMTNRKDLIDEALLRPGRLELQMEISLPDVNGRLQILDIHTKNLRLNSKLSDDVDLLSIAKETRNFSGAEIEGLVRAASTTAMTRLVKVDENIKINPNEVNNFMVCKTDFELALTNDIKPAFGSINEDFDAALTKGIYHFSNDVTDVIEDGMLLINQTIVADSLFPISILLHGSEGSGKSAIAAYFAKNSNFPLIRTCSAANFIGLPESAKCLAIKKIFDDSYRSELSCIIFEDIERIIEYVSIGPRFSNAVLQTLLVLFNKRPPKNRKLLIVATCLDLAVMKDLGISQVFQRKLRVPLIANTNELIKFVQNYKFFNETEIESLKTKIGNYFDVSYRKLPVKKVMVLAEMSLQVIDGSSVDKFVQLLREEAHE